jgi:hypothetical protein
MHNLIGFLSSHNGMPLAAIGVLFISLALLNLVRAIRLARYR